MSQSNHAIVDSFLKKHQLNLTESRRKILQLFLLQPEALAHADIERRADEKFDRVTIYRTLQTFVEKGIIHSIPTADNTIRYALCKDECTEGHHHDHHVHFICIQCDKTECLDHITVPDVKVPGGYQVTKTEVILNGLCKNCKK